jgi:diaminopimelate epimerase
MTEQLEFYKMTGAGNDFIVADNRGGAWSVHDLNALARGLCRRGTSIGADGLVLIENSMRGRFKVRIFNSDGSQARMCGNGTRCASRFAFLKVIAGRRMVIETSAGMLDAEICDGTDVSLRMPVRAEIPRALSLRLQGHPISACFADAGVPHLVVFVNDAERAPVATLGPALRWHPEAGEGGANVNFVQLNGERGPHLIRTFERGVEAETLSCGTGVTATAWILYKLFHKPALQSFKVRSGRVLEVEIEETGLGDIGVRLKGEARVVYRAFLSDESLAEALG